MMLHRVTELRHVNIDCRIFWSTFKPDVLLTPPLTHTHTQVSASMRIHLQSCKYNCRDNIKPPK